MKRILLNIFIVILAILAADMIMLESLKRFGTNSAPLQIAEDTNSPNTNFLFASNASLPGRIYMTLFGKDFKPCINTVSSFFNKYYTCSNCADFEANPKINTAGSYIFTNTCNIFRITKIGKCCSNFSICTY